jgi:photosystem II stability/assembly factor-like uncharacterized protein
MDRLRRDLRDLFSRRQQGLGYVNQSAGRLLAAGLERRAPARGNNRTHLFAGVATIVIAALVVSTFLYVRSAGLLRNSHTVASGTRTSPTASAALPSTSPSPKPPPVRVVGDRAVPIDVDLVDSRDGWALLTNCNAAKSVPCNYFVGFTADGGDSWSLGLKVGPKFDPHDGDAPRHVHFSDAQNGFVWGGLEAYSTHDGGRTWADASLNASQYVSFVGRGGLVWAVSYPCKKGSGLSGDCVFQIRSSRDGGRNWSAPYLLPATFNRVEATAFGERGVLVNSLGVAGALITTDGGATWRRIGAKCAATSVGEFITTSDGTRLIKACVLDAHGTTIFMTMYISADGGRTWTEPQMVGVGPFLPECEFPIVMASTGQSGAAAMASLRCTIALTHDGGSTWTEVGPQAAGFVAITFGNPKDGWALDTQQNIWVTTDGGGRWVTTLATPLIPKAGPAASPSATARPLPSPTSVSGARRSA